MKICKMCKLEKHISAFMFVRTNRSGGKCSEKECVRCAECRAHQYQYIKKHAAKRKAMGLPQYYKTPTKEQRRRQVFISRKNKLRRKYGLTLGAYDSMFRERNGACDICGNQNLNGRLLDVDHDHKTNKVRGLLCRLCNHVLGHAKDNIQTLYRAADYLEKQSIKGLVYR